MTKEHDIDTLARTLYGEARGESKDGKIAVACVILNRVKRKVQCGYRIVGGQKIPTIAATCLKPWQFSCWNENDPNRKVIIQVSEQNKIFAECVEIAKLAVDGLLNDHTKGATHYYAPKVCPQPKWAKGKAPCAAIGSHLFFNNVD